MKGTEITLPELYTRFSEEFLDTQHTLLGQLPLNSLRKAIKNIEFLEKMPALDTKIYCTAGQHVADLIIPLERIKYEFFQEGLYLKLRIPLVKLKFLDGFEYDFRSIEHTYYLDRDSKENMLDLQNTLKKLYSNPTHLPRTLLPMFNVFQCWYSDRPLDTTSQYIQKLNIIVDIGQRLGVTYSFERMVQDFYFEIRNRVKINDVVDKKLVGILKRLNEIEKFFYQEDDAVLLKYDGRTFVLDKYNNDDYRLYGEDHPVAKRGQLAEQLSK